MKSLIKMAMMVAMLTMVNTLAANTELPVFKIKTTGEKTLLFELAEPMSSAMEVIFQDEEGATLFSEYTIHPASFTRYYNLSELPEGQYYLLVKSDVTTQLLPITITKKELIMDWNLLETM